MRYLAHYLFTTLILLGCKTPEPQTPPTVITLVASDVTLKNAKLTGDVTNEGFSTISERGFVFSEKIDNPTLSDTKVQSGYGKGVYSVVLDKLTVNTRYYFKAYATNTKGTSYGVVQSFTTADYSLSSLSTDVPQNITFNSVEVGGNVTNEGGGSVIERGFCFSLNTNPTINDYKYIANSRGSGTFSLVATSLKENTKYFIRSYAINEKGVAYGNEQIFTTLIAPEIPRDNTTKVVEVKSRTGRIWMDRNLGASQVATSPTDQEAYGDLYQWGRLADGHQKRNSPNTTILSTTDQPINGNFIISKSSIDWRSPRNGNLWQGVYGVNNPCPVGYRLPTITEWDLERLSWSSNDFNGAFTSPLKLPNAGYRTYDFYNPSVVSPGNSGSYWSSTEDFNKVDSYHLYFGSDANKTYSNRANGLSVRCIKD